MTAKTFVKFRKDVPGAAVIVHVIHEESVTAAVAYSGAIIASDAVPFLNGVGHPRGAGTFARVLGVYVREKHSVTLMDASGKMTLLPARRLESIARPCTVGGPDFAVYHSAYDLTRTNPKTKAPAHEHGNLPIGFKRQTDGALKVAWEIASDTPAPK